jgi:excinuclease ABC subunit A
MVKVLDVVADRFRIGQVEKGRVVEAIEVALKRGAGRLNVYVMPAGAESSDSELWRFSSGPALPGQRPALHRSDSVGLLVQLGCRRL